MEIFDLAVSYKWEYDKEFVDLIERNFQKDGLRTFVVESFNLNETVSLLKNKEIHFKAYLDRASDEDPSFLPLTKILSRKKCHLINPHSKVVKSINKASMHKKLLKKNFRLPQTLILPPYDYDSVLSISEDKLISLGKPFVIKPAFFSGGGEGVVKDAETLSEIETERMKNHNDKYLIQQKIYPRKFKNKRAWFRVFWAFDKVIPSWWDDHTHIYSPVLKSEIKKYNLLPLYRAVARLSRITKLDYFSTEIALTKDHKFFLIDYVNDQCDMRLKSLHPDGVPDIIVKEFIDRMKNFVKKI